MLHVASDVNVTWASVNEMDNSQRQDFYSTSFTDFIPIVSKRAKHEIEINKQRNSIKQMKALKQEQG